MMVAIASTGKKNGTLDLAPFKQLLMRSCGHTFEQERSQALSTALDRRMTRLGIDHYQNYHALLLSDPNELLQLTELLTVNETYFFREPEHLRLLIDTLIPELMNFRKERPIRILSAGCSSGEEPYSLAMMLREKFGAESETLFVITGVDIDSKVIAAAKEGLYGKNSFRGIDPALLDRYFEPCGAGKFQVKAPIMKQVDFAVVNLLDEDYPARVQGPDIILYRNVSIYFPGQVQKEIFGKLAALLNDGGCLLVGATETSHHDTGILALVKHDSLFYYSKPTIVIDADRRKSSRYPWRRSESSQPAAVPAAKPGQQLNRKFTEDRPEPVHQNQHPAISPEARKRFDLALEMARNKEYDKALAILDVVIEQNTGFEKAYALKGSLLMSLSRFHEAKIVCDTILNREPLCLDAYLMLGMIARQKGNTIDALKRFREAIYIDTCCWLAHFYSAEILFAEREGKRARNSYEAVLKILGKGSLQKHGQDYFPLSFNADQFMVICRHKLSLLKENGQIDGI